MGQKVHPIGFRLGVETKRIKKQTNPTTQEFTDIFDRKHFFNFSASNKDQSQTLHSKFMLKNQTEELFTKAGFFINHLFIEKLSSKGESKESFIIKVDVLHRSNTSFLQGSLINSKGLALATQGHGVESSDNAKPTLRHAERTQGRESVIYFSGAQRKLTWTTRKLKWHSLTKSDLLFLSKFFEENITNGVPVKWKVRILNKTLSSTNVIKLLFKRLGRSKSQPFFNDGLNAFSLVLNEPSAPLLANQIAQELSQLRKHSNFIQFIKEGLSEGLDYKAQEKSVNLSGFLVQIKGRINGSDRSRRLTIRKGSIPLHTMNAAIDQSFSEALTIYGKVSVKVQLKQD